MNFKKVVIKNKEILSNQEIEVIDLFNKNFSNNEVYLQRNDDKLILELREIDIQKLQKLQKNHKNRLLEEILQKIQSIKSYGLIYGKRKFVDYNTERKVENRKKKSENRGKYYYTQEHNFSKKNYELPKQFENKIICGNSLKILESFPANCIDIVFTSPPYNFGLEYANQEDAHFWKKYFEQLFSIFDETIRVLKYGGRVVVNIQPLFSDCIPSHHIISKYFMDKKMIWKGEILWEKNNYNCKYTAWGSWKSPSSPYLKYTWEFLEIFSKGDLKHPGDKKNVDMTEEEFKEYVIAKWSIAPEKKMKQYGHPAMFPEKLVERILKLFSFKNDIVLDPFNGVGTTTAVAKKLDRKYIGIDISEKYCKIAEKRTGDILPENRLFL